MMDFTGAVKSLVQQMIFKNPKTPNSRPELNMLYQMQKQKDKHFGFFESNEYKVHSALLPCRKTLFDCNTIPQVECHK